MVVEARSESRLERALAPATRGHDALGLIAAQLAVADLIARPATPPPVPDRSYRSNEALWADLLVERLWASAVVGLEGFWLSEWLPLRPGLFHTHEAHWQREYAEQFVLTDPATTARAIEHCEEELGRRIPADVAERLRRDAVRVFDPHGKESMLKGGVGCIRLKDRRVDGETLWFMGASSTHAAHEGVVVALPGDLRDRVIGDIRARGALRCHLIGRLTYLPAEFDPLYAEFVGIPQVYVRIEEVEPETQVSDHEFVATGAVMVRTDAQSVSRVPYDVWDLARGIGTAYVSFVPGRPSSIESASQWLAETYVSGVMGGAVVTDFDEQVRRFRDATFGLRSITDGSVNIQAALDVVERCGGSRHVTQLVANKIEISGGMVMGDQITVGDITGSQGIAIGKNASARVTGHNLSGEVRIDPGELRAALGELYDAVGDLDLPREQKITAQTATGTALQGVTDKEVDARTVTSNLERAGEALKQADVAVQQGTSLWEHITRLGDLLGPVVGGARIVLGWFGIPLP
jgi:hypothetical protein